VACIAAEGFTMNMRLFIGVFALAFMAIFVLQNMEVVSVDFLIWSVEASRVIIYLTVFLIGFGIGWLGKSLKGR
jgi:uncharacterized integral membrane protein